MGVLSAAVCQGHLQDCSYGCGERWRNLDRRRRDSVAAVKAAGVADKITTFRPAAGLARIPGRQEITGVEALSNKYNVTSIDYRENATSES